MKKLLYLTGILLFTVTTAYAQDCNLNENAQRYKVRAEAAYREAKNDADFLNVVEEFKKALQYAPDCADIIYNIATCYDKSASSGLLKDIWGCGKAMEYYKKYLVLKPDAQNKQVVQNRIYELEYKYEKLDKFIGLSFFLGIDPNVSQSKKNTLEWFVSPLGGLIEIKDNNQINIFLIYNFWSSVRSSPGELHVDSIRLVAENYKTKENVECLKFCVQNLKIMDSSEWDKKKNSYKKPGNYSIIGCCYYLKLTNEKFVLEFEPKYIHQYENNRETQNSINLNNSPEGIDIFNRIYEGEIVWHESSSTATTPTPAAVPSDDKETTKKKTKSAIGDDVYLQKDNKTTTEKAKSTTMATSVISSLIGGR